MQSDSKKQEKTVVVGINEELHAKVKERAGLIGIGIQDFVEFALTAALRKGSKKAVSDTK